MYVIIVDFEIKEGVDAFMPLMTKMPLPAARRARMPAVRRLPGS